MVAGAFCLAELWQSAWVEGNGDDTFNNLGQAVGKNVLLTLYNDRTFVESRWLKNMHFDP